MDSATWCRTPAAASAGRRLRPEVSKNSSTALSSNDANWRGRSPPARRPCLFEPRAGDGVEAAFGRAGDDLVTLFAQNGDALRADQAGAPDNDNLHGLPRLSSVRKHRGGRLGS